MTQFLRLLTDEDKAEALLTACTRMRSGEVEPRYFEVDSESFDAVPGKPFAYWVSEAVRDVFANFPAVEDSILVTSGTGTLDDFRFLRGWWEVAFIKGWFSFAKGGAYSPIYYDQHLLVSWADDGAEMKEWIVFRYGGGHWARNIRSTEHYFRPGLTWPRRTNGLSFRVMPANCIFADKGPAAFIENDDPVELLALSCLLNSPAFKLLVSMQLARTELAQSYEVGLIQQTPRPPLTAEQREHLTSLARRAWMLKRTLDTVTETSHAFLLPATLRVRLGDYDPPAIELELAQIQAEIDAIAFDLYGFVEADRQLVNGIEAQSDTATAEDDDADDEAEPVIPATDALLSWAVGVAFGRFDCRLATSERAVPPQPDPFDPLPSKSPAMLPDGDAPFYPHSGILVDDPGHADDLARLVENVLERVALPVPDDVRRWLQRDFFAFHLQRYSKSRRKAPIYWPLTTPSGSYTLWLYYPSMNSQTLYTATNNYVEPKLKQVSVETATLRNKTSRSSEEETRYEQCQTQEMELLALRDNLIKLAAHYHPNHDDGVQICAAPLWQLFRHKAWQTLLKVTWAKLEKGDYDWAHIAMHHWPDRVREKCKTDKSLAIAHGLEALYVEPEPKPKTVRAKKQKDA